MKIVVKMNVFTVILFIFSFCNSYSGEEQNANIQTIEPSVTNSVVENNNSLDTTVENDTITIIGVGDIMLGTLIPSKSYLPANNDCSPLLVQTTPVLSDADITFGNLEGVFTNTKSGAKKCNNPKTCYTFGMPDKYVYCLKDAGFDVLSIANNHVGDFGAAGRANTVRVIEEAGINFAGLVSCPSTIFEKNGIKYGFCAFAPNRGTVQITDYKKAKEIVCKLNDSCDIVIVSFHGGAEGSKHQHVTRNYEYFLGQNRGNVYQFAREVIDAGADIVFGHGPHVTRAIDIYKDRFIIYSMGNFCTYSNINIRGVSGLAPIIKVKTDKNGKFLKGQIIPTYQEKYKPPKIDPQKRVINIIKQLTKNDIPELNINITDDGYIKYL